MSFSILRRGDDTIWVELIPRITAFLIVGSIVITDHKDPIIITPTATYLRYCFWSVINNGTTSVETISLLFRPKYGKTIKLATTAPISIIEPLLIPMIYPAPNDKGESATLTPKTEPNDLNPYITKSEPILNPLWAKVINADIKEP